jgi:hypothetical protein
VVVVVVVVRLGWCKREVWMTAARDLAAPPLSWAGALGSIRRHRHDTMHDLIKCAAILE